MASLGHDLSVPRDGDDLARAGLDASPVRPRDREVRLMARKATGSIATRENRDGSLSHDIRVRWKRERVTITLTAVSRAVAEAERELILAKIRAGVFDPDDYRAALHPGARGLGSRGDHDPCLGVRVHGRVEG
jgi:hypothetical protein